MADRTPEEIGAATGAALADSILDALEAVTAPLVQAVRAVQEDQAAMREQLHALAQRIEALEPRGHSRRRV
jgi:hypothetical protein